MAATARPWVIAAALSALFLGWSVTAEAGSPFDLCRQAGTDDRLRPVPPSLVQDVMRLFRLENMPIEQVERSTYYRCADHRVLVCTVGANLPCGKADRRQTLPEADTWCAAHPGTTDIPAYVTGHATIYDWRCDGPKAKPQGAGVAVDGRGFITQYWKPVGPD